MIRFPFLSLSSSLGCCALLEYISLFPFSPSSALYLYLQIVMLPLLTPATDTTFPSTTCMFMFYILSQTHPHRTYPYPHTPAFIRCSIFIPLSPLYIFFLLFSRFPRFLNFLNTWTFSYARFTWLLLLNASDHNYKLFGVRMALERKT